MNSHINISKIDTYTKEEYNIAKYDEMVKFYNWLESQTIKFTNAESALKAYRNSENTSAAEAQPQQAPCYTKKSFKNRQQLNSLLRRNGYRWAKVAPMGEAEENQYGESFRWELFTPANKITTVDQALKEIN